MRWHSWVLAGLASAGCGVSGTPTETVPEWRLVEERRIGDLDGPASFGEIRDFGVDARHRIWILDYQAQEIRVFDSSGVHLFTAGRKGSGPGELAQANGLAVAPDGTAWTYDPAGMRLTGYEASGRTTRQLTVRSAGYGYQWEGAIDSAGRLWDPYLVRDDSGAEPRLRWRYRHFFASLDGADTLDLATCDRPAGRSPTLTLKGPRGFAQIPNQPASLAATDYDGRLGCIPWSAEGAGLILDLQTGDTLVRFAAPAATLPVSAAARDSQVSRLTEVAAEIGAEFSASMVPENRPAITAIHFDDRGGVWVARTLANGEWGFDLFDARGRREAFVRAPNIGAFLLPSFHGDVVYFQTKGPDDLPQIARARIVRQD